MTATYGPATENDPRLLTADGHVIEDGGRYFNYYDMEWVRVEFGDSMTSPSGEYWNGWFTTYVDNGDDMPGSRRSLNGERMSSVEPAWSRKK